MLATPVKTTLRALLFGVLAALPLSGCQTESDDVDIIEPLQSSGHALTSAGYGRSGPSTSLDGGSTEVWAVTSDWADTDTPSARAAGMAWPANSGLNWEEKFGLWVEQMSETTIHGSSRRTFELTTPHGKTLPSPSMECAELGMVLRVLFASWYGLPFYMEAVDGAGTRLFAGHFGFRTPAGRYRNTPNYRTRYNDYSHLSAADALASWPSDATLRRRHIYGGGSDTNGFLTGDAGAGHYFDEILLNKRTGYFLLSLLPYFGSINLADDANAYHVQAHAVRPGDVLLKRWQKRGIGHVMVVKEVDQLPNERLAATIVSGSMPRRQGYWESPAGSKMNFTNPYTGGEGENRDGDAYVDLFGGLKRFLAPQRHNGKWRQHVVRDDFDDYIRVSDRSTRAARPARFEELLSNPDPETLRDELLALIEAKRAHLRSYPASCSARTAREEVFEQLYELMQEEFGMSRDQVDSEYRNLEDYVFAELEYAESKTCCWNSTTTAMYEIVMDHAEAQQASGCTSPVVFAARNGGYDLWSDHAASLGRANEWVAWSADETCPQGNVENDTESVHGWTPWCEIAGGVQNPTVDSPDPFEPNNTAEQAFLLEVGTYEGPAITSGDEDWFTFQPPTGALVRFGIEFAHSTGDLDVQMLRGGLQVDSSTSPAADTEVVDTTYNGIDQILVKVYGGEGAEGPYTINVEFEGGHDMGPACNTDDDSMETATPIDAGTYQELALCDGDLEDWFRIGGTTGGGSAGISFEHARGDLDIELYRGNGELIGTSQGTGDTETVESPPGVRYLRVFGYNGAVGAYTLSIIDD